MTVAAPQPPRPGRSALYSVVTAILLACCGPLGLIALWLGPWSTRSKVIITVVWLVIFGPATFYYVGQYYYHPSTMPTPSPQ